MEAENQVVVQTQVAEKQEEDKNTVIDFKMVTFSLADKDYSLDIMHVKEIVSEFVFYNLFLNEKDLAHGFFCMYVQELNVETGELVNTPNLAASTTLARASLLVWRSSTFVIPITIGGLVTAFYRSSPKNEAHMQGDIPNRQTFISLQQETYIERNEEVASLIETSKLSREAILEKLKPKKPKKKPKEKAKNSPANLEKQDYDEVDIDGLEDD